MASRSPRRILILFFILTALRPVFGRDSIIMAPGCGKFVSGNGTKVPHCGTKSSFACGRDRKPLGFLHIPKCAGTTIEGLGREHGIRWGRFHKSSDPRAMCVDQEVHEGGVDYNLVYPPYSSIQATLTAHLADLTMPCNFCHIPPHRLPEEYNPYDEGENFCIIRNPFKRFVSDYSYTFCYDMFREFTGKGAWMFQGMFDIPHCSPEGLNHFLQLGIRRYKSKDPMYMFVGDCHFLPQYEYVFGPDGRRWCHHVLKFEELPHNFNALMKEQGLPLHLGSRADNAGSCAERKCHVTVQDLTPETMDLIREVYHKDFELGGYV